MYHLLIELREHLLGCLAGVIQPSWRQEPVLCEEAIVRSCEAYFNRQLARSALTLVASATIHRLQPKTQGLPAQKTLLTQQPMLLLLVWGWEPATRLL